jgi:hypothetical protein
VLTNFIRSFENNEKILKTEEIVGRNPNILTAEEKRSYLEKEGKEMIE